MKFDNDSWAGFKGDVWKKEINVRDFIQNNYTPYWGDDSFWFRLRKRHAKSGTS